MNKRKTPKSLLKPLPIVDNRESAADNVVQFELELCWCVQQLEQSLYSGKFSQKHAEEATRNIKTLKSFTVPLVRKRQLMKTLFGDYRTKMKEEEKKLGLAARQVKFTENAKAQQKFNFVKKAAILSSGKDFRFNFTPSTEDSEDQNQENLKTDYQPSSLILSSGAGFKFDFNVEEDDDINLNDLSIKS